MKENKKKNNNFFIVLLQLQIEEVKSLGVVDIDTGRPLPSSVYSMNAYLGYMYIYKYIYVI